MPFTGPAEDRLAIRDLLDAYADAVTQRDAAAWAATWAGDSEWTLLDFPEIGTIKGRDAIVAMWTEAMKGFPGLAFQAWPGSIEVEGERAVVRSYTSEVYDQAGMTKRDRGVYVDSCVRVDGRWLFESRAFRYLHRQG
ncbi:MAG: nuclear transport factor 2 family protein [Sphingomonas sp.]